MLTALLIAAAAVGWGLWLRERELHIASVERHLATVERWHQDMADQQEKQAAVLATLDALKAALFGAREASDTPPGQSEPPAPPEIRAMELSRETREAMREGLGAELEMAGSELERLLDHIEEELLS